MPARPRGVVASPGPLPLSINIDYSIDAAQSTSVDSVTMSPMLNTEDLITAAEVAEILGLSHYNSVTTYLNRYESFPRPVIERSGGRIRLWLRQDIETWATDRRR